MEIDTDKAHELCSVPQPIDQWSAVLDARETDHPAYTSAHLLPHTVRLGGETVHYVCLSARDCMRDGMFFGAELPFTVEAAPKPATTDDMVRRFASLLLSPYPVYTGGTLLLLNTNGLNTHRSMPRTVCSVLLADQLLATVMHFAHITGDQTHVDALNQAFSDCLKTFRHLMRRDKQNNGSRGLDVLHFTYTVTHLNIIEQTVLSLLGIDQKFHGELFTPIQRPAPHEITQEAHAQVMQYLWHIADLEAFLRLTEREVRENCVRDKLGKALRKQVLTKHKLAPVFDTRVVTREMLVAVARDPPNYDALMARIITDHLAFSEDNEQVPAPPKAAEAEAKEP